MSEATEDDELLSRFVGDLICADCIQGGYFTGRASDLALEEVVERRAVERIIRARAHREWGMEKQPPKLTLKDLQAMRRKLGVNGSYSIVQDDLKQIRISGQLGLDIGDWADSRGLSRSYAEALRCYLEQQHLWDPLEDYF